MSKIKDPELKNLGLKKIEWVKSYMPVLAGIERDFLRTKPLSGLTIAISIHLEAKTAYLASVLKSGGANLFITGCNPLSTQDEIAAALDFLGFEVFATHGASESEYKSDLKSALSCRPDYLIDDGGDLISLLHGESSDCARNLKGGCEETTTGVKRLRARHAQKKLFFPMIAVNDADCKRLFDNRYGTGQSTFDGIMHTTNLMIAGKTVVVAGYGMCSRGIAMRARGLGAITVVTEVDEGKALEAAMDGYLVMPMDKAAELGDLFITSTGCRDILTKRHFERMKDGAILANSGHFDVEINKDDLLSLSTCVVQRKPDIQGYVMRDGRVLNLLAEGRLVNIAAGNGHPAEIMDMSFSLQALCLEYLSKSGTLPPGVYPVPDRIDREVAKRKLFAMGLSIDALSDGQKSYLSGF